MAKYEVRSGKTGALYEIESPSDPTEAQVRQMLESVEGGKELPKVGPFQTVGVEAAASAIPSAGAALGSLPAMAAGRATGLALGRLLGGGAGSALGPIGTVVGGVGGGYLGSMAGEWLQDKALGLFPDFQSYVNDLREAGREQQRGPQALGRFIGALPSFGLGSPKEGIKQIGDLASFAANANRTKDVVQAAQNAAVDIGSKAGLGVGLPLAEWALHGHKPDAFDLGESVATQFLLGHNRFAPKPGVNLADLAERQARADKLAKDNTPLGQQAASDWATAILKHYNEDGFTPETFNKTVADFAKQQGIQISPTANHADYVKWVASLIKAPKATPKSLQVDPDAGLRTSVSTKGETSLADLLMKAKGEEPVKTGLEDIQAAPRMEMQPGQHEAWQRSLHQDPTEILLDRIKNDPSYELSPGDQVLFDAWKRKVLHQQQEAPRQAPKVAPVEEAVKPWPTLEPQPAQQQQGMGQLYMPLGAATPRVEAKGTAESLVPPVEPPKPRPVVAQPPIELGRSSELNPPEKGHSVLVDLSNKPIEAFKPSTTVSPPPTKVEGQFKAKLMSIAAPEGKTAPDPAQAIKDIQALYLDWVNEKPLVGNERIPKESHHTALAFGDAFETLGHIEPNLEGLAKEVTQGIVNHGRRLNPKYAWDILNKQRERLVAKYAESGTVLAPAQEEGYRIALAEAAKRGEPFRKALTPSQVRRSEVDADGAPGETRAVSSGVAKQTIAEVSKVLEKIARGEMKGSPDFLEAEIASLAKKVNDLAVQDPKLRDDPRYKKLFSADGLVEQARERVSQDAKGEVVEETSTQPIASEQQKNAARKRVIAEVGPAPTLDRLPKVEGVEPADLYKGMMEAYNGKLIKLIQGGDSVVASEALGILVEANQGLIIGQIGKYLHTNPDTQLMPGDLKSAAEAALGKSAKGYDAERGKDSTIVTHFSTAIQNAFKALQLEQSGRFSSGYRVKQSDAYNTVEADLTGEFGRTPTHEEVKAELIKRGKMTGGEADEARKFRHLEEEPITPDKDDETGEYSNIEESEHLADPNSDFTQRLDQHEMAPFLEQLPDYYKQFAEYAFEHGDEAAARKMAKQGYKLTDRGWRMNIENAVEHYKKTREVKIPELGKAEVTPKPHTQKELGLSQEKTNQLQNKWSPGQYDPAESAKFDHRPYLQEGHFDKFDLNKLLPAVKDGTLDTGDKWDKGATRAALRALLEHTIDPETKSRLDNLLVDFRDANESRQLGEFNWSKSTQDYLASKEGLATIQLAVREGGQPLSQVLFSHALLHELTHSAITSKLKPGTSIFERASRWFTKLQGLVKGDGRWEKSQTMESVDEALAASTANGEFRELLGSTSYAKPEGGARVSMLQQALNIVKQALGIKAKDYSMLDEAFDIHANLLNEERGMSVHNQMLADQDQATKESTSKMTSDEAKINARKFNFNYKKFNESWGKVKSGEGFGDEIHNLVRYGVGTIHEGIKRELALSNNAIAYNLPHQAGNHAETAIARTMGASHSDVMDAAATFVHQNSHEKIQRVLAEIEGGKTKDRNILGNELVAMTERLLGITPRTLSLAETLKIADKHYDTLKAKTSVEIAKQMDSQWEFDVANKTVKSAGARKENYLPLITKAAQEAGEYDFTKEAHLGNVLDAILQGGGAAPLEVRASKLANQRVTSGYKRAAGRLMRQHIMAEKMPGDSTNDKAIGGGRPVMIDKAKFDAAKESARAKIGNDEVKLDAWEKRWKEATGEDFYKTVRIYGEEMMVHKGIAKFLENLTAHSFTSTHPVIQTAHDVTQSAKHLFLLGDAFHMSRTAIYSLAIRGSASYKKGALLSRWSPEDIAKAYQEGHPDISKEFYEWSREPLWEGGKTRHELLIDLTKHALSTVKEGDLLSQTVAEKFPFGLGKYNKWLFGEFIPGLMAETALYQFEVNRQTLGGYRDTSRTTKSSMEQLLYKTADEINKRFGNMGATGLFVNRNFRQMMQIAFLAPWWVEGLAWNDAKALGDFAHFAKDKALQKEGQKVALGMAGKSLATSAAAFMMMNQIINMITRGKPTWENDEKDPIRMFDAWVPGGDHGFYIDPLSTVGETLHSLAAGMSRDKSGVDIVTGILRNKLNPVTRGVLTAINKRDFWGEPLDGSWEAFKTGVMEATPVPMLVRPTLEHKSGGFERQLVATGGIKMEPVRPMEAADTKAREVARELYPGKSYDDLRLFEKMKAQVEAEKRFPEIKEKPLSTAARSERYVDETFFMGQKIRKQLPPEVRGALDEQKLNVSGVSPLLTVGGRRVYLTAAEKDEYASTVAKEAGPLLKRIVTSPSFAQRPQEAKQKVINSIINAIKNSAKGKLIGKMNKGTPPQSSQEAMAMSSIKDESDDYPQ